MNAKELSKLVPASKKKSAIIILDDRVEETNSVSFTYHFKNQKESHLKVSRKEWNKYEFQVEDDVVYITKHPGLVVITNSSGWKRLGKPEQEDNDE